MSTKTYMVEYINFSKIFTWIKIKNNGEILLIFKCLPTCRLDQPWILHDTSRVTSESIWGQFHRKSVTIKDLPFLTWSFLENLWLLALEAELWLFCFLWLGSHPCHRFLSLHPWLIWICKDAIIEGKIFTLAHFSKYDKEKNNLCLWFKKYGIGNYIWVNRTNFSS